MLRKVFYSLVSAITCTVAWAGGPECDKCDPRGRCECPFNYPDCDCAYRATVAAIQDGRWGYPGDGKQPHVAIRTLRGSDPGYVWSNGVETMGPRAPHYSDPNPVGVIPVVVLPW